MITGVVRDRFPRVVLNLAAAHATIDIEFIVDMAFDGELSLPPDMIRRIGLEPHGTRSLMLADGTLTKSFYHHAFVEWSEESRLTEILLLDTNPLLGVEMLKEVLLQVEMTVRGEVRIEDL